MDYDLIEDTVRLLKLPANRPLEILIDVLAPVALSPVSKHVSQLPTEVVDGLHLLWLVEESDGMAHLIEQLFPLLVLVAVDVVNLDRLITKLDGIQLDSVWHEVEANYVLFTK